MLDGQGKVRLTDFGLAGLAAALAGEDVRSGTPSYMSPEQLAGREVTVRSDIYALGLLIYELVTGRRAFEGKGLAELTRKHRDERPIDPSAIVSDLDPAIERTILACLEKDPKRRPPSALVVSAMLAGRDPLEAAIAAGETPSPELVAAAGETEGLRPRTAWLCLAAVVVGVLVLPALQAGRHLLTRVPIEKSPAALEDRARELLTRLGQPKPIDHEVGVAYDGDYVRWTQEREASTARWDSLATGEPPLVQYWYRQSPQQLVAQNLGGRVAWNDPPIQSAGMAGVRYDFRGRLLSLYVVPPQLERPESTAEPEGSPARRAVVEPDWTSIFAEAQLDKAAFRRVEPVWTPPFFVDARFAWEGHWPARPDLALRVEAASYRGQHVWFETRSPWTRPEREGARSLGGPGPRRIQAFYVVFTVLLVIVGGVLAYRNISLGRGDRRGAFRLALALATIGTASWALRAHHVADPGAELAAFAKGTGLALVVACLVWVFYLALEPYVRRLRPWTLVSWTRLLNGGVSDAVVGRDVLVGLAFGTFIALLSQALRSLPGRPPDLFGVDALLSSGILLSHIVGRVVNSVLGGLALLLLFLILRLATRRDWIAAPLVVVFLISGELAESVQSQDSVWLVLLLSVMAWGAFVVLLLRLGLLAGITAVWTADVLLGPAVIYAPGSWTGATAYVVVPLLLVMAALAFRRATSGHPDARRFLAGEPSSSGPT
jgi:serine/threonine-protein kinase